MKTKTQRNRRSTDHQVRAKFDRRTGIVHLNVPLSVKADTIDLTERTFEGLAATWDEDLGSDIIEKGAFKKSIVEWKGSSEAMPLLNSHDHYDIFSALGQALSMKETDQGLLVKWEVIDGEDGDKVLQRLRPSPRTGRAIIGKMSIGFVPLKYNYEQPEGTTDMWDRIRRITEADLKEVSLVLFPMNPGASIDATSVKMFLKMAHDADPKNLDGVTRMELRRLNSRIGLLLKKQKPDDDEELDDSDEQDTPTSRKKSSTPPKARKADDTVDDADDEDEELDGDEEEDGLSDDGSDDADDSDDEEGDEEDTPEEDVKPEGKSKTKPKDKKEDKADDAPKPYIFSEALAQRINKVTLQHKIGEVKK